ncbi:MAG: hypothetical protein MUP49_05240 [Dehalococcoidia bacterium]|nr:hypothetical protein [Dehalococcoidia bacterium]
MGWFSRQLPDSEKEGAVALVRHLQEMLAYQQLAMETYNDALAAIAGDPPPGAEVWKRATADFSSPALVSEYVIPALAKKIEIIQLMETKHKLKSTLVPVKLQLPYQTMTSAISVMLERAHLQYDEFTQWIQNPQTAVNVRRLDKPELSAIDRAVKALNDLIKRVGLTPDEWMDLNQQVFNSVRTSLGLVPLDRDVFCSRYFRGLSGERVHFFSD